MQGMVLSVFAKRKLLNQIRFVKSDWIGTGYANFWGNKGTVSSLSKSFRTWFPTWFRTDLNSISNLVLKRMKRSCFNSFGNQWSFAGYYKYTSSPWYRTGPISSSTRLHSKNFFESEFWKLFFATGSRVSHSKSYSMTHWRFSSRNRDESVF